MAELFARSSKPWNVLLAGKACRCDKAGLRAYGKLNVGGADRRGK